MPDSITLKLHPDQLRALVAWCPITQGEPRTLSLSVYERRTMIETALLLSAELAKVDRFHDRLVFRGLDAEMLGAIVARAAELERKAAKEKPAERATRGRKRSGRKPGRPRKPRQMTVDDALADQAADDMAAEDAAEATL